MSVYFSRSTTASLDSSRTGASDTLFANERFEANTLESGTYEYCTFANISFKDTSLSQCRFSACVFEACYFRDTTIDRCRFPASRFIDCEFVKPTIRLSDFAYSRFKGCAPPFKELYGNLPSEANVRADLAANLATQCGLLGDQQEARLFRIEARKARERDLRAAATHESEYYKTHYDTLGRLGAAWRWTLSRANGLLWGYGERAYVLLLNLVAATLILFPVLFLLTGSDIRDGRSDANYWDCLLLSFASLVNTPSVAGLTIDGTARSFVVAETLVGLVALGLFVTYLLRWISRR